MGGWVGVTGQEREREREMFTHTHMHPPTQHAYATHTPPSHTTRNATNKTKRPTQHTYALHTHPSHTTRIYNKQKRYRKEGEDARARIATLTGRRGELKAKMEQLVGGMGGCVGRKGGGGRFFFVLLFWFMARNEHVDNLHSKHKYTHVHTRTRPTPAF